MVITGEQTQQVSITITPYEQERIVREGDVTNSLLLHKLSMNLCKEAGVHEDSHINLKTGKWEHTYDVSGPHDHEVTATFRDATEEEIEKDNAIKEMYRLFVNNK